MIYSSLNLLFFISVISGWLTVFTNFRLVGLGGGQVKGAGDSMRSACMGPLAPY